MLSRHENTVCEKLEALPPDFYHGLTSFHKLIMIKQNTANPKRSTSALSDPDSEWDDEPLDEDEGSDAGGVDAPTGYGPQTKSASNFFRRFTAQETFDSSDQHNERSFKAYDKDNDGSLSTKELTQGLLTGGNFDFTSYPIVYLKLLGILQNIELTDETAALMKQTPQKFMTWNISFNIYNALIKKLKFQVLFNLQVVRRMFKVLRYQRLMALAPGIRFLRKIETSAKQEIKSARSDKPSNTNTQPPDSNQPSIELQESSLLMSSREVRYET